MQWVVAGMATVAVLILAFDMFRRRRSDSEFERLVRESPAALVVMDETTVLYANDRVVAVVGGSNRESVIGRPLAEVLDDATTERAVEAHRRVRDSGQALVMKDVPVGGRNGVVVLCDLTIVPVEFRGRAAVQCSFNPVDEKHAAELALQATEERFQRFFEDLPVAMYRTRLDGTIVHANKALVRLLGSDADDDLEGVNAVGFYIDPEDRAELAAELAGTGLIENHISKLRTADGREIWIHDSSHTILDDGEMIFEGILIDVTREQEFNSELRRRAAQQQALAEIAHQALREVDVGIVLKSAARTICDVLGAECVAVAQAEEGHGLATTTVEYSVDSVRDREVLLGYVHEHIRLGEGDGQVQALAAVPDGEGGKDLGGCLIPLAGPTDDYGVVCVAGRGFSPTDQDLDFLVTTAATLGSAISRSRARSRLDHLMRSKDQFVASVSHELRTPLTVVAGLALELENGWRMFDENELGEFISLIADQSREMGDLIEDLLVAARADIGKVPIHPEQVDVGACIDHVIAAMSLADRARISVSANGVRAYADPVRCRQIIRNLITNAIRYGGSRIHVSAEPEADDCSLVVFDDGAGVAREDRDKIFGAYERARSHNGAVPGSVGLGLTVSRQLTELMGGSISYRYEGGSFFEVRLPTQPPATAG